MKPTLLERETIINFNEAEDEAMVYTFNPRLIKMISAQGERKGQKIEFINMGEGEVKCYIPKSWIKIQAPKNLSEEAKEKLKASADRMRIKRELLKEE